MSSNGYSGSRSDLPGRVVVTDTGRTVHIFQRIGGFLYDISTLNRSVSRSERNGVHSVWPRFLYDVADKGADTSFHESSQVPLIAGREAQYLINAIQIGYIDNEELMPCFLDYFSSSMVTLVKNREMRYQTQIGQMKDVLVSDYSRFVRFGCTLSMPQEFSRKDLINFYMQSREEILDCIQNRGSVRILLGLGYLGCVSFTDEPVEAPAPSDIIREWSEAEARAHEVELILPGEGRMIVLDEDEEGNENESGDSK